MITFVVIGRNEGWRLEKCLKSVHSVATKELDIPYEVVYVDSQSSDGSLELAAKYADRCYLITGVCNAAIGRNIGAREAKGDVLFFLDGDMELRSGIFPTILTPEGSLISPFVSGVDYDCLYDRNWQLKAERVRRDFKPGHASWHPTTGGLFVIEKTVWDNVGGMDNRFRRSQDMDFGFMAYSKGFPLKRMGQIWVNHHTMFYAVRNNELSMTKYSAMLLRKHFFERVFQYSVFKNNYSSYYLVFCILYTVCNPSISVLFFFISYLVLATYRASKVMKKSAHAVSFWDSLRKRILKDVILIEAFICYHPQQPQVSYKEV